MQPQARALTPRWIMRAMAMMAAALICMVPWAETAAAHGSIVDPASRNYGCWQRWGSDFQNPNMAQQDPMCWQAWQDNPNAMWNWNGLYRNGVGGNHQAAVPNGQLCSGGQAEGGRYNSLDAVGPWKTTDVGSNFSVKLYDQASHGADYFRVYVTRQGFNPATQPLTWQNLELVKTTGRYAPSQNITVDVNAPGRSGHHVVFTIWQASHMDQAYYLCSDVNFR
ncbi:lytic polysaccharide monooxygenase auxiliary activity family 9 protein [Streptomyces sp. TRM 70351]|uniref:lytic polysaccharide monooxygenase auxiliary activity family 9 protein n=1 Tax=Streptomyces sp. TRM 70351 TaxID=3116552 RepID=UPI002E7B6ADB|nr:lytic polysaccharide monooxygenase auxiliary activity family 9 protein [Streptomyces sp. TRM 70351]MEE1929736.1 lytic polysaccharide monooxygenase auxiliary activity family 9 protein [Streptomyces sp. TRM 70351]